jgi:hypothetical protein
MEEMFTNIAAAGADLTNLLETNDTVPLGSKKAWMEIQQESEICRRFLDLKRQGQLPGRKDKNKTVLNKMLKRCEISEEVIVAKEFDDKTMREVKKTFVPPMFLPSILTVMHIKTHPPATQLQRLFEKYFVAFNLLKACEELSAQCSLCISLARFPKELVQYDPQLVPHHPGSHMNVDVMKRASQNILVNCDLFSGYVTAEIIQSEKREHMVNGILSLITPVRHSDRVLVRVDRAPALRSLSNTPDQELDSNGITLDLGEHFNKNSNCSVDKKIQELEAEIRRISPKETKLSYGELTRAVTMLNNRVRNQGLSAAQLHFSRDTIAGRNLHLNDKKIIDDKIQKSKENHPVSSKSKSPSGKPHNPADVSPGQLVYVRDGLSKHDARDPLLVTGVEGTKVRAKKVLHSHDNSSKNPRISSEKITVDEKFLYVPPHRRTSVSLEQGSSNDSWWRRSQPVKIKNVISSWTPTHRPEDDEDCYMDLPPPPDKPAQTDLNSDNEDSVTDGSEEAVSNDSEEYDDTVGEPEVQEEGDQVEEEVREEDDQMLEGDEQSEIAEDTVQGDNAQEEVTSDDDDGAFTFIQNRPPKKGDLVICYNDKEKRWMIIRLTYGKNKYYEDYYNFKCIRTGAAGGQYLRKDGMWGYIDEAEADVIDLDTFGTTQATITQVDGGITPDSLTTASGSPEGSFVDDNYSDQESVFGNCEMEYMARSLDGKFTRTHEGHHIGCESDINARMFRISQTLDLEIPRSSATAIEVEQYVEHPSAASFPENDVEIPSYHYHLGRRRIISLSSPELGEEMTSDATWRSRIWAWGKSYRRRR